MLAWGLNLWGGFLTVLGCVGLMVGVGIAATNLVLRYDQTINRVVEEDRQRTEQERRAKLDDLDQRLVEDRDKRDQTYLRQLRKMHEILHEDIRAKKVSIGPEMLNRLERIFLATIVSLEDNYKLWQSARKLPSASQAKTDLLEKREAILVEVEKSVDFFSKCVVELQTTTAGNSDELATLRDETAIQLDAARRAKEMLADLDGIERRRDFSEYE